MNKILVLLMCFLMCGCTIQLGVGNRVLSSSGKTIEAGVAKDFGKDNQAEIGTTKMGANNESTNSSNP